MATEVNNELLVNVKTALGSVVALPTTPGPGLSSITTTAVRQPVDVANAIIKAADPNRMGLSIFNSSPAGRNMFVKLGATASLGAGTESFTRRLGPSEYWEIPSAYTGRVDAIWDGADANGEALITERFSGFSPLSLSGYQIWLRGDQGLLAGAAMPYWVDSAGLRVPLLQATALNQPTQTAAVINGRDVVRFGPATSHRMTWSPVWTMPLTVSIYVVIKMVTVANFQLVFLGGSANSIYLGGNAGTGFNNRPAIFGGAQMRANWPTALTNGTNYLVKWRSTRTNVAAIDYATQVDDTAEATETAAGTGADTFNGMGFGGQDLLSDVAEVVIYDRVLSTVEQQQLWDYFNAKYAIF